MKAKPCLALAICAVLLAPHLRTTAADGVSGYVEYKGHKVAVAKAYRDFDEYKNDPNNLSRAQAGYATQLVKKVKFGPKFKDANALFVALDELQFPGYGYFVANQVGAQLDPKLEIAYVELPRSGTNRYLVAERQADGGYTVVADFVAPAEPEITRVRRATDGTLRYEGVGGKVIVPAKGGS